MKVQQGDIVLLRFPFSDLGGSKVRPAIVISNDEYNSKSGDFIAVAITSNLQSRGYSIMITSHDLESGKLVVNSKIKPDKVFSASRSLVRLNIGRVRKEILDRVLGVLSEITKPSPTST